MRFLFSLCFFWSLIVQSSPTILRKHSTIERNQDAANVLLPPSLDPFYQPPQNWETSTPGTYLRLRKSPYTDITIDNCIDTFQVLYRTTDTNNNASWAATTVFIPATQANCTNTTDSCSHGLVSYLIPYDSADPDAAPSYWLQFGEPYGEMKDLLARGWFVNVPDYEGPNSSYCAGVQSGHATLDSIKAVLQVTDQFGFQTSKAKAAIWGYSGGAMAAEFAAELAGTYAPDLQLAGSVIGGTIPDLAKVAPRMNKQDAAGLLIAGLVGITSQHQEARDFLISRMHEEGSHNMSRFFSATTKNGVQTLLDFEYEDIFPYFANGSLDLNDPIILAMYAKDGTMGVHGVPNMPTFIYKAIQDEMSPVNETDILVAGYCEKGANILYHRNTLGTHNTELWSGRQRALDYLGDVIDGRNDLVRPLTGCTNLTVMIDLPLNLTDMHLYPPNMSNGLAIHNLMRVTNITRINAED